MSAYRSPAVHLAQLNADRETAFVRRLCAWCSCSIARRRRDARCCSASCRCRFWRRRRALTSAASVLGAASPDHTNPHTMGDEPR